jgi:hypothetical protein
MAEWGIFPIWRWAQVMKAVAKYYESLWGRPSRVDEFYAAGARILIHKWDVGATDEGVALYATVGASEGENLGDHRVEFIAGLLPEEDGIMPALAGLASFPSARGPVNKGDTVTLGGPLWSTTEMQAFLVVPEVDEFIPTLSLSGYHVEFLRALPVYDSEVKLKKELGPGWLMEQMHAQGIRMSSPARPPVWDTRR